MRSQYYNYSYHSFPSDGAEYPRTENLSQFISIVFVGSRLQFESLIPSGFSDVHDLRVRVEVVYLWLRALKHLNPLYHNASIIETEAMRTKLLKISSNLLASATVVATEAEIIIDQLVTPDGATDIPSDETQEENGEIPDRPMPVSLLTRSIPVSRDPTESASAAFRGLIGKNNTNLIILFMKLNLINLETFGATENVNSCLSSKDTSPNNIDQVLEFCLVLGSRYIYFYKK